MWLTALLSTTLTVLADGGQAPQPGLVVDLLNLQWWQALVGIVGLLGLSPAPWLLGLATNRIQFTAPAQAEKQRALDEKDRHYQALIAEKDKTSEGYRLAAEKNKERADHVTDAALDMTRVIEANTHVIASVNEIAREAGQA